MKEKKIPNYLPVAPMLPWIQERIALETVEGFALRCNVSSRRFNEIINGRAKMMSFQNIDKMLTSEGSRTIIDFFPEYADDDVFFSDEFKSAQATVAPKRRCSIDGCDGAHHSRGLCNRHYRRHKKGAVVA